MSTFTLPEPQISQQDLMLIKKVAFYASQYDWFLKSDHAKSLKFTRKEHSLFPFFNTLLEQYRLLISDPDSWPTDPSQVLVTAKQKAGELAQVAQQTSEAVENDEKERIEFALIDWQDFTVLQTVNFGAKDLTAKMPSSITAQDIVRTPLDQRESFFSTEGKGEEAFVVSPFTGERIRASEYDDHVKVLNTMSKDTKKRQPQSSNLYFDDVEENLRHWKKQRTNA